jgi:hypothetical protein
MRYEQKKAALYIPILLVFVFMAIIPIAAAADPPDFIIMYKDFFKDIQEKKYLKAWEAMTVVSKNQVAKEIADAAVKKNLNYTQAQMLGMLEKDTKNVRTNYFDNLIVEWEKTSFLSQMQTAPYKVKSSTKKCVVLTITLESEPKDFQIIQEEGKWKINFFDDLFR